MASESGQWARPAPQPAVAASTEETSEALLVHFFSNSRAAASVAGRLRSGAEVGVTFTDVSGDFRFHAPGGKPTLERKKAASPDFDLRIGPGAVRIICERPDADIGDLGILFFERILARAPDDQIRVKLHSGLVQLTLRGWLAVLAQGGPKVVAWLARKGLAGPSAVPAALARLRG